MTPTPPIHTHRRLLGAFGPLAAVLFLTACPGTDPVSPDPDPEPTNNAPVAAAGADQTVSATLPVMLDGSASTDADGDAITYSWSFASTPGGSAAAFDDATSATPTFTPDLPGTYTAQLVVNDGTEDSAADQLTVTAEDNSSSAMIGSGGGQVVSKDGNLTLDIPAGALASDEEITVTSVPANQYPDELADSGPDDVVYDLKPDGLQFAQPVTVTFEAPPAWQPVVSGDTVSLPVVAMMTFSGGSFEPAGNPLIAGDADAGTATLTGEIDHFSKWVMSSVYSETGVGVIFSVAARQIHPSSAFVGQIFEVHVHTRPWFGHGSNVVDRSSGPVGPAGQYQSDTWLNDPEGRREITNPYECVSDGTGTIASTVKVWDTFRKYLISKQNPLTVELSGSIECKHTFASFVAEQVLGPERVRRLEAPSGTPSPTSSVVAHEGGARLLGPSGQSLADFSAPALSFLPVFGAEGNDEDGIVVFSSQGLHRYAGPLPAPPPAAARGVGRSSHPSLTLEVQPQPGTGPDLSAHATDVYHFGATGSRGMAAVLYGDQDIAFFDSGTDSGAGAGFIFDNTLATSFKPGGVSVFGAIDYPVSVYVQPNGFTDADPILVITEANDATLETKLWLVERSGSTVTATHVNTLFPYPGGRSVRCLDGVCAVTAYGTNVGFGGTTMFAWDGASGITHIQTLLGRTIGTDLSHTSNGDVQIATTSFNDDSFTVHLISAAGQYLNSAFTAAPVGCTGPGHVAFRQENEVILTCNTSGEVVSEFFNYPPTS